jgi:hypothetical protein
MITLRRESIAALASVRVMELPKWIGPCSRKGVYWHIPRSAMDFGDRLSIQMWCGVHFNARRLKTGKPPAGAKCGTCAGRYEGAEGLNGLIFSPRDVFAPPRLCPGEDIVDGRCAACGELCRPWLGRPQRHAPGPEFSRRFRPCPDHGWRDVRMSWTTGRLVCWASVGGDWGRCDFDCGLHGIEAAA